MTKSEPSQVKHALCDRIAGALQILWEEDTFSDEAVHEVRKQLKRARAALRLLRASLGEVTYARENARLRDAARPLSHVRDSAVMLETLDQLMEKDDPEWRADLLLLRERLEAEQQALRRDALKARRLREIELALEESAQRIEDQSLELDSSASVQSCLGRIYRKGRKALDRARGDGSDEALHEARKQTKYLAHALSVIDPGESGPFAGLMERAEQVADDLGTDHDLVVLAHRIAALGADPALTSALLSQINARRTKLQRKALTEAQKLFRRKPKKFLRKSWPEPAAAHGQRTAQSAAQSH
jgi:CHAD domain-containing protein